MRIDHRSAPRPPTPADRAAQAGHGGATAEARRDAVWDRVVRTQHAALPARAEIPAVDLDSALDSDEARTSARLGRWLGHALEGPASAGALAFLVGGFVGSLPGALAGGLVGLGLAGAAASATVPAAAIQGVRRLAQKPQAISAKAELVPAPGSPYSGLFAAGAPCLVSIVAGRTGAYLRVDAFTAAPEALVWRGGDRSDADLARWAKVDAEGRAVANTWAPTNVALTTFTADEGVGLRAEAPRPAGADWRESVRDGARDPWNLYARDSAGGLRPAGTLRLASEWVPSAHGDEHLT